MDESHLDSGRPVENLLVSRIIQNSLFESVLLPILPLSKNNLPHNLQETSLFSARSCSDFIGSTALTLWQESFKQALANPTVGNNHLTALSAVFV